jgi:hypothetical protein
VVTTSTCLSVNGRVTERASTNTPIGCPSRKEFSKHYSTMSEVETKLDKLIGLIKPVKQVPFDWYVPWQDIYYRSSSATTPLAARVAANGERSSE